MLATFVVNKTLIRAFQVICKACDEKNKNKKNIFFWNELCWQEQKICIRPPTKN